MPGLHLLTWDDPRYKDGKKARRLCVMLPKMSLYTF